MPLCPMATVSRSFCMAMNWATRSLYANKEGALEPGDALAQFLAQRAEWLGCGGSGGDPFCAASLTATVGVKVRVLCSRVALATRGIPAALRCFWRSLARTQCLARFFVLTRLTQLSHSSVHTHVAP